MGCRWACSLVERQGTKSLETKPKQEGVGAAEGAVHHAYYNYMAFLGRLPGRVGLDA